METQRQCDAIVHVTLRIKALVDHRESNRPCSIALALRPPKAWYELQPTPQRHLPARIQYRCSAAP